MATYTKSQQRKLDQLPVNKPVAWSMGDREILDAFNSFAKCDEDVSTEYLIQMTADYCRVSYSRVVEALSKPK